LIPTITAKIDTSLSIHTDKVISLQTEPHNGNTNNQDENVWAMQTFLETNHPLLKGANFLVSKKPPNFELPPDRQLTVLDLHDYTTLNASTVYVNPDGTLKRAIIFLPSGTVTPENKNDIILTLAKIPTYHSSTLRSKKKCETGKAYGLFWRKAYIPPTKEPYGPYVAKKKWRKNKKNIKEYRSFVDEVAKKVVKPLDEIAKTFNESYFKRTLVKKNLNIPLLNPNLDNSSITTVYCSQQYGIALHKDNDHGLAFALWLLEHSERCHTKSRKCLEGWYFIFLGRQNCSPFTRLHFHNLGH